MALNQNSSLDRLWAATQPTEPSAEVFDKIWAKATAQAAEPEAPTILAFSGWRKWGLIAAVTAQAAALLVAAFVAWNHPAPVDNSLAMGPAPTPVQVHDLRVEEGKTLFVSLDGKGMMASVELRPETPESETDVVAVETDVLSFMESLP